jgi:diguanylate cyclase (GGDEF)-like protein/PAS domain S-box-containing protein
LGAGLHFFLGHALSNLTFAPILILLLQGEIASSFQRFRSRKVEAAGLLALSFVTTIVSFAQASFPLLFLPVLPLILVTFRLGRGGAVVSMLFLALFGGAMTLSGGGPAQLIAASQGLRVQFFQFYLAMTVLTAWPVAADLSNRSRIHRRLRVSEAQYRLLADHSSDILMQLSVDAKIRYVSPSIRQLGGYDPAKLVGTNAGELIAPQYREIIRAMHTATMREPGTTHCFDYEAMTADGTHRWFETHSRAIIDEKGAIDGTLSIIRDVSARKATEEALSRAAMTDILTGLPNRRAFQQRIDERLRDRRRVAGQDCIAVLDIDHFKRVNDQYGHDAGDAVLQSFASIARCAVREQEMVVRLGGEEFAILFTDTNIEQAAAICDRLRREVAEAVTIVDDLIIRMTVSGGVAPVGPDGLEHALKAADAALYRAKHNGRDQMALAA